MNVIEIELSKIKPYEKNPRKNDRAVDGVAESIKQFGFQQPIVIDKKNVIIVGHTRYKAAQKLGLTTVPCVRADDLTKEQVKAYRIADNKLNELATWDFELLGQELASFEFDFQPFEFTLPTTTLEDIFETPSVPDSLNIDAETSSSSSDVNQPPAAPITLNDSDVCSQADVSPQYINKPRLLIIFKSDEDKMRFSQVIGREVSIDVDSIEWDYNEDE